LEDYRNPDYIEYLKSKIEEWSIKENIKLLGIIERKEQLNLIKNAYALIQPSLFEGGAGAGGVKEALTLKKPVIMSDIEINKEYSKYGVLYFEKKNAQDLANKIEEILKKENKIYSNEQLQAEYEKNKHEYIERIYKPVEYLLNQ